eukprot:3101099-Pleurochrysis_carterae.AAC.1
MASSALSPPLEGDAGVCRAAPSARRCLRAIGFFGVNNGVEAVCVVFAGNGVGSDFTGCALRCDCRCNCRCGTSCGCVPAGSPGAGTAAASRTETPGSIRHYPRSEEARAGRSACSKSA